MCKLIFRIIITCLCMIMTSSVFAAQRAIISDGWYKIVPVHVQSKALDSAGAGKNAGTNLQIWDFVDAPQQKFYVQHRGNGWYSFKAGHCDLYVDAQGGVPRRGENVWLYTWNGSDAQLWGLYNAGDGYYIETKMQSNLVFDCAGAGRNNGNNVQLWSKENVGWHKWKFVRVSPPQSHTQPQSAEKYVVSTNGATLALRSGPGTNYGIKVKMPRGSVVEVYSISNGWANLSYNGTRGYASASYLRKQGDVEIDKDWDRYVGRVPDNLNLNSICYQSNSKNNPFKKSYWGNDGKYHKTNCTWYAYGRFYEVNGQKLGVTGMPNKWGGQARNNGFLIGTSPRSKSVAVAEKHVMFVENVSNGYVYFTEANYGNDFIVKKMSISEFTSKRKVQKYIYAK